MNDNARYRVGPMLNPPHLGELIRESMDEVGWMSAAVVKVPEAAS